MVYAFLCHSLRLKVTSASTSSQAAPSGGTSRRTLSAQVADDVLIPSANVRSGGGSANVQRTGLNPASPPPTPTAASAAPAAAPAAAPGDVEDEQAAIENRVWLAKFYTKEGNDRRTVPRREAIAARVREEYAQHTSTSRREQLRGVFSLPGARAWLDSEDEDEDELDDEAEDSEALFEEPKVVVWQQYAECAFVLVLEDDRACANVSLAANWLTVFMSAVVEHFAKFDCFLSPVLFYNRPEEVFVLLDKFLPCGQLSYIRGNSVKVMLEEAQALLQMKSLIKTL